MKELVICILLLGPSALGDLTNDVQSWTNGPYVAFVGDSITAGYPSYSPASDGGPSGDTNANVAAQLLTITGGLVTATNFGVQGKRWVPSGSFGLAYNVTNAAKTKPRFIFVRCGVNDIIAGNSWTSVLEQVNLVKTICTASNALMVIQDILPKTSGDDAFALTIRTWNSNFTAWAATSDVRRVTDHDLFGTNRTSTGFKDDIIPDYNVDGTHYKDGAYPLWARISYTNLLEWATPVMGSARANSATVHHITLQ